METQQCFIFGLKSNREATDIASRVMVRADVRLDAIIVSSNECSYCLQEGRQSSNFAESSCAEGPVKQKRAIAKEHVTF